jgi:RNA polymerase sigma-70 factor (ECF subfamily)
MDASQRLRDAHLALRCQLGEAEAFRELIGEMERPLLYFAGRLLADDDAALDVLQQAWMRALRTIRRLEQPEQLRSWLYSLVRGLAIDRIRKRYSIQRLEQEFAEQNVEADDEPAFGDDDAAAVHQAIDQLPPRLKEVVLLHLLEDLPIAEVAAIVGCPEGTVKSRLYYGKRALRTLLAKETP